MHLLGVKDFDQGGNYILHATYGNQLCFDDPKFDGAHINGVDMALFYETVYNLRSNDELKALFSKITWEKRPETLVVDTYEEAQHIQNCSDARNLQKLFVANSIESVERYNKYEHDKFGEVAESNSANIQVMDGQKKIVLIDYQFDGPEDWQEAFIFNLAEDCLEIVSRKPFYKRGKGKMAKRVIKR